MWTLGFDGSRNGWIKSIYYYKNWQIDYKEMQNANKELKKGLWSEFKRSEELKTTA